MSMKKIALAAALGAALTVPVLAGPEWVENDNVNGMGDDAGSTAGGAQSTSGGGSFNGIRGTLAGVGTTLGAPSDFQDLFIICIDDPQNFYASTLPTDGGFANFNPSLYLFDVNGLGLLGNMNHVMVTAGGSSTGGAKVMGPATDGTGQDIIQSGLYIIGITTDDFTPLGNDDEIFDFESEGEISGPDGAGADRAVSDWEAHPGACCFYGKGSYCENLYLELECTELGGIFLGPDSSCEFLGDVCPEPTGACCLNEGVAGFCVEEVTADECSLLGGSFAGANSTCVACTVATDGGPARGAPRATDPAVLAPGAGDAPVYPTQGPGFPGEYVIMLNGACFANQVPLGACCLAGGGCVVLTEFDCAQSGGTWQGPGTGCGACGSGPDRISGTEKGSLLIWSKVEIRWDAAGNVLQDTFIDITNDLGEAVNVQMYFVNGDPAAEAGELGPGERAHPGWNWVDVGIQLTANQPAYWSALTGQPGPDGAAVSPFTILDPSADPTQQGRPAPDGSGERVLRGFIYAWAVDEQGCETYHDHLKGDALLVNYADGTAWEYNAWAAQRLAFDTAPCIIVQCGLLPLGAAYAPAYSHLLLDFHAVGSTAFSGGNPPQTVSIDTDLTLHPVSVDLRQETDGPVTTKASFVIWNEDETQLTGLHRCITCWDQTLLGQYAVVGNHFLLANLQTDKGKARIDGLESQLCHVDFVIEDPPLELGADPRDIISQNAALLGVQAKHLVFNATGRRDHAGGNLVGMGAESAAIFYDPVPGPGTPPTATAP